MSAGDNDMVNSFMEAMENMKALLDAIDGYRAECERRGYSPTVAEAMALQYHQMMLAAMVANHQASSG